MYKKDKEKKIEIAPAKAPQVFVERTLLMATYSVYKIATEFGLQLDVVKGIKIGAEVGVDEAIAKKMVEKGIIEIIKEVSDG